MFNLEQIRMIPERIEELTFTDGCFDLIFQHGSFISPEGARRAPEVTLFSFKRRGYYHPGNINSSMKNMEKFLFQKEITPTCLM